MTIETPTLPAPSFAGAFEDPEDNGPPESVLLYGNTGTRKTSAIGELVKAGFFKKVLVINIDKSTEVLSNDPEVRAALHDGRITLVGIDQFDPTARLQIEKIILEVSGAYRDINGNILFSPHAPDFGYDLIVVDTVNLVGEVGLKHLKATTHNDRGDKLDGLKAYGKFGTWMDEMIRLIHNSDRFVGLFLSHEKTYEEKNGSNLVKPKMEGAFKDSFPSIPSMVAHLRWAKHPETGQPSLVATVGESELYSSKNRYRLPSEIYDFNLADVYRDIYTKIGLPLPAEVNNTEQKETA